MKPKQQKPKLKVAKFRKTICALALKPDPPYRNQVGPWDI